jgi:hypothetical protein
MVRDGLVRRNAHLKSLPRHQSDSTPKAQVSAREAAPVVPRGYLRERVASG